MEKIEEEPIVQIYELSDKQETKEEGKILEFEDSISVHKLTSEININDEPISPTNDFQKRMEKITEKISDLKEKIKMEKQMWRKEIDELNKLQLQIAEYNSKAIETLQESNDSVLPKQLDDWLSKYSLVRVKSNEYYFVDRSRNEIKNQLKWYQTASAKAQSKRRLSADMYKEKLLHLEQMCNWELARLHETAAHLDPLKKIASEWKLAKEDFQSPEYSKSTYFSISRGLEKNNVASELDFKLSGTRLSSSNVKINHRFDSGESTEKNEFSLKMNANLKITETQKCPLWKGDGIQESGSDLSKQECPALANTFDCIFKNNDVL